MKNRLIGRAILVIDDDPGLLRALEKVLQSEGALVKCAQWGGDAIEILTRRTQPIDLVITDLRMPLLNGVTVVYAIHEAFPALPVIVLTAFGNDEARAACFDQGAVAFLEKPLDSQKLIFAVLEALKSRSSKRPGSQATATAASGARWSDAIQHPTLASSYPEPDSMKGQKRDHRSGVKAAAGH